MRKFIIATLAATILVPAAASAQSRAEVRQGQREVRQDQRELDRARAMGDRRNVREAREELREDRRELREDRRDLRQNRRGGYAYRGGAYRGPQGYRYRPVAVGHRFAPTYYGRNYWVNDYASYNLTRPRYGYQRWVRYGGDVVLVDTRSGRVVQVRNRYFR